MKYAITSQRECRRIFNAEIKPDIIARYGKSDWTALDEAFNDWTDALCKDGVISDRAYNAWSRC